MKKIATIVFFLYSLIAAGQENTILHVDSTDLQNDYLEQMKTGSMFKHAPIKVSEQTVRKVLDKQPAFGVYKDNYMVTGMPLNKNINKQTADAFFQFSIRQRITKSELPFNSFLYIIYSQKSFWDIYDDSSPFRDNNYNPGFGIGRYVIKNNVLKGALSASFEHESNGKAYEESRSWNYLNLSAKYFYNMRLSMKAQVYVPYVDSDNNRDLLKYKGYGMFSIDAIDRKNLWWLSADFMIRDKVINSNVHLSLSYRFSHNAKQYFTIDYYGGYAEGLLHYKKYTSQLRVGFVIKPDFFNAY